MNLSKLSGLFSRIFYTDKADIKRVVVGKTSSGATRNTLPDAPLYANVPCKISFQQSNEDRVQSADDATPYLKEISLFFAPDIDIQEGDTVIATKMNGDQELFKYTGQCAVPQHQASHQQVTLRIKGHL